MNTREISIKYKVPLSVVEYELERIKVDLTEKGLTGTDLVEETEGLIHFVLDGMTSKSKGEIYNGLILAADRIKDNANPYGKPSKRQLCVDEYVANPEATVAAGKIAVLTMNADGKTIRTMKNKKTGTVVDVEVAADIWKEYIIAVGDQKVVPLDDMRLWPSGKENFGYLHNLPIHQYRTNILVVLKTTEGYKLTNLDYNSERLPGVIPMNVPVDFIANPKEDKDGIKQLASNRFTAFELSAEPFGKTPQELIQTYLAGIKYKLDKLEAYHTQMVKAGKQWDTLVLVEAYVRDIRGLDNRPYLHINDNTLEQPMQVWLNNGIDINFGVESKVFIIGKTGRSDKYDPVTKTKLKGVPGDTTISAMGVCTKFNTSPTNVKPLTSLKL